jgi:UDP-N-acetylmuramoyl-tripeptide--D-alanyl-D-alanine ligase
MATAIPTNSATFSLEEVVTAVNAAVTGHPSFTHCVGVTTDSRDHVEGKLFIALSGEKFDGHRYVADVLSRGAVGAIVEREVSGCDSALTLRVPSTLDALGQLAHHHRIRWGKRVVTIGGSAGKTTTRAATQAFLSALLPGKVHGTVGNLNNLVGVPMSLLAIDGHHEIAVIEIGTNQRGEVERLSRICQGNVAVLTCIGLEHSEGLGDLDSIEDEESAMYRHLADGAQVVGLADDWRVMRQMSVFDEVKRWTYGLSERATHRIIDRVVLDRERTEVRIERKRPEKVGEISMRTRLFGLPGALASAAAFTVADALNLSVQPSIAVSALDRQVGEAGRLRVLERSDRALIIDDCYNANPISMRSSFGVAQELARTESRRLFFVLGDMRELGEQSCREHRALAEALEGVSDVVAVGSEMLAFVDRARELGRRVHHFADSDSAKKFVAEHTRPEDVVLVKGSRGIALERIVTELIGGEGRAR